MPFQRILVCFSVPAWQLTVTLAPGDSLLASLGTMYTSIIQTYTQVNTHTYKVNTCIFKVTDTTALQVSWEARLVQEIVLALRTCYSLGKRKIWTRTHGTLLKGMFNTDSTGSVEKKQEPWEENSRIHLHDKGRPQKHCERGGVCVEEPSHTCITAQGAHCSKGS